QNYALYPHMTVFENMAFGLKLRKVKKELIKTKVSEAAQILSIADKLERRPRELSGGERQRVAVGRTIVRQPLVFLFDEPLSNLDAKMRVQMRTELNKLHKNLGKGTTFIYVTHDQTEAMTMATRIMVMKDGVIQQIGEPMYIFDNPVNRFVAGFIGSPPMNFFEGKIIQKEDGYYFDGGSFRVKTDEKISAYLAPYKDKEIIMGIRPHEIRDKMFVEEKYVSPPNIVRARVEIIEKMGYEKIISFNSGKHGFVAKLERRSRVETGQDIELVFNTSRLYFFEKDDEGRNILYKDKGSFTSQEPVQPNKTRGSPRLGKLKIFIQTLYFVFAFKTIPLWAMSSSGKSDFINCESVCLFLTVVFFFIPMLAFAIFCFWHGLAAEISGFKERHKEKAAVLPDTEGPDIESKEWRIEQIRKVIPEIEKYREGKKLIDYGIIPGGGIDGLRYYQIIEAIEKEGYCFTNLGATSIGAIVALFLMLGYDAKSAKEKAYDTDASGFSNPPVGRIGFIRNLLSHGGISKGDAVLEWIRSLIIDRFGFIPTFGELKEANYPFNLTVTAVDYLTKRLLKLNAENCPDMPIDLAIRASISLPVIFNPVIWVGKYKGEYRRWELIDGSIHPEGSLPLSLFDEAGLKPWKSNCIAFPLMDVRAPDAVNTEQLKILKKTLEYIKERPLLNIMVVSLFRLISWVLPVANIIVKTIETENEPFARDALLNRWKSHIKIIKISDVNSLKFNLSREEKEKKFYVEASNESLLAAIKGTVRPKYFYFKMKPILTYIFTSDIAGLVRKVFRFQDEIPEQILKESVRKSRSMYLLWGDKDIKFSASEKGCEDRRFKERSCIEKTIREIKKLAPGIISALSAFGYLNGWVPEEVEEAYGKFLDEKIIDIVALEITGQTYPFLAQGKNGYRCYIRHSLKRGAIYISGPVYNILKYYPNLLAAAIGWQSFLMFLEVYGYYQAAKNDLGADDWGTFLKLYAKPVELHKKCEENKIIFLSQVQERKLLLEYERDFVESAERFKSSIAKGLDEFINGLKTSSPNDSGKNKNELLSKKSAVPEYFDSDLQKFSKEQNLQKLTGYLEKIAQGKEAGEEIVICLPHRDQEKDGGNSAFLGAHLFTEIKNILSEEEKKVQYFPVMNDSLDKGTRDVFGDVGIKEEDLIYYRDIEELIKNISRMPPEARTKIKLILFDHNEVEREELKAFEIIWIGDHHPKLNAIPAPKGSIIKDSKSCTCAILAQMYFEFDVRVSPAIAYLLADAIISDEDVVADADSLQGFTFKSRIAVREDSLMLDKLIKIARIKDIAAWINKLGRDEYCTKDSSVEELLRDSKKYLYKGQEVCVGQAKFCQLEYVVPQKSNALIDALRKQRAEGNFRAVSWMPTHLDGDNYGTDSIICADEDFIEAIMNAAACSKVITGSLIRSLMANPATKKYQRRRLPAHININDCLNELGDYFTRRLSRGEQRKLFRLVVATLNNIPQDDDSRAALILAERLEKAFEELELSFNAEKVKQLLELKKLGKDVYQLHLAEIGSRKAEMWVLIKEAFNTLILENYTLNKNFPLPLKDLKPQNVQPNGICGPPSTRIKGRIIVLFRNFGDCGDAAEAAGFAKGLKMLVPEVEIKLVNVKRRPEDEAVFNNIIKINFGKFLADSGIELVFQEIGTLKEELKNEDILISVSEGWEKSVFEALTEAPNVKISLEEYDYMPPIKGASFADMKNNTPPALMLKAGFGEDTIGFFAGSSTPAYREYYDSLDSQKKLAERKKILSDIFAASGIRKTSRVRLDNFSRTLIGLAYVHNSIAEYLQMLGFSERENEEFARKGKIIFVSANGARESECLQKETIKGGFGYLDPSGNIEASGRGSEAIIAPLGNLPHELFSKLLIISDLPVAVTGDMSLTEAISAGKVFLYETREWKTRLFINLVDKIIKFNKEKILTDEEALALGKALCSFNYYPLWNQTPVQLEETDYRDLRQETAKVFYDPQYKELYKKFSRGILAGNDPYGKILNIINQLLAEQSKSAANSTKLCPESVNKEDPRGYHGIAKQEVRKPEVFLEKKNGEAGLRIYLIGGELTEMEQESLPSQVEKILEGILIHAPPQMKIQVELIGRKNGKFFEIRRYRNTLVFVIHWLLIENPRLQKILLPDICLHETGELKELHCPPEEAHKRACHNAHIYYRDHRKELGAFLLGVEQLKGIAEIDKSYIREMERISTIAVLSNEFRRPPEESTQIITEIDGRALSNTYGTVDRVPAGFWNWLSGMGIGVIWFKAPWEESELSGKLMQKWNKEDNETLKRVP
ncbi:MAG: patatin-like phospholipase family protein, partial [Candidatus Omnitrophica bacterium]|nr:patatin-like phospholipase family protein [Candidatus Omnitrophota bacterium]